MTVAQGAGLGESGAPRWEVLSRPLDSSAQANAPPERFTDASAFPEPSDDVPGPVGDDHEDDREDLGAHRDTPRRMEGHSRLSARTATLSISRASLSERRLSASRRSHQSTKAAAARPIASSYTVSAGLAPTRTPILPVWRNVKHPCGTASRVARRQERTGPCGAPAR